MEEYPSTDMRAVVRDILQRVIDDLLFYSDEMEMHRLPQYDGVRALRLAAGLLSITRELA